MLGTIQNIFELKKKRGGLLKTLLQICHRAGQTLLSGVCTSKLKHAPIPPQNSQVNGSYRKLLVSMCVMPPVNVFSAKTWVKIYLWDCKIWHIHLACAKRVDNYF